MQFPNIALVGEAGSGKSTLAQMLVERHNYARIALAGPLKLEVARIFLGKYASPAECFAYVEANKAALRGLLQSDGVAKRDLIDRDHWVKMTMLGAATRNAESRPVVVDDCRFANEAAHFRAAGWIIVRVHRPQPEGNTISRDQRQHVSEREATAILDDHGIYNDRDTEHLYRQLARCLGPGGVFDEIRYMRQQEGGR